MSLFCYELELQVVKRAWLIGGTSKNQDNLSASTAGMIAPFYVYHYGTSKCAPAIRLATFTVYKPLNAT